MQDFTLHTHSIGFDGHNTVEEMISAAQMLGFSTIGISNHFIVHPEIKRSRFYPFSVKSGYSVIYSETFTEVLSRFKQHYADIEKISEYSGIRVLRGMEVDFFDDTDWLTEFMQAIKELKPDYIIGSSHFVYYDGYLCNVHDMANADESARDDMLKLYWNKVQLAAESRLFNWLAHLDLPKKVGIGQDEKWFDTERLVLKSICNSKTGIEINTGLYSPTIYEPYPSARILKTAAEYDIPVVISDDAHGVGHLGRHFEDAMQFAQNCGVKNFMSLQKILDFSAETV